MSKSESIVLKNIGAIKEASIELGDFTRYRTTSLCTTFAF